MAPFRSYRQTYKKQRNHDRKADLVCLALLGISYRNAKFHRILIWEIRDVT